MVPEEKGERMGVANRPPAEGIVNWVSALATEDVLIKKGGGEKSEEIEE